VLLEVRELLVGLVGLLLDRDFLVGCEAFQVFAMFGISPLLSLPVTKVIGPRALAPALASLLLFPLPPPPQPATRTVALSRETAAMATLGLIVCSPSDVVFRF